jgi:hypothetical protein
MDEAAVRKLLDAVRTGQVDIDAAVASLRSLPFEDLGFARVDHHRAIRCGSPEVIFCPGKTSGQVAEIFARLAETGLPVLATRAEPAVYEAVVERVAAAEYEEAARAIVLRRPDCRPVGLVAVVAAGTSDLPVAEEARVTAEMGGARVSTHYDVGVAGLHRLLAVTPQVQRAHAVVVVAGMEGALASVVGGIVAAPVIGVPTSVGYGASFGGLSALLTMLNSCASGVSVVNIDNGFGAGYAARIINRRREKD